MTPRLDGIRAGRSHRKGIPAVTNITPRNNHNRRTLRATVIVQRVVRFAGLVAMRLWLGPARCLRIGCGPLLRTSLAARPVRLRPARQGRIVKRDACGLAVVRVMRRDGADD